MPSLADTPLHDLLNAAKDGDQGAYEVLLERYTPLIESLIGAHTSADADDFRQEAYIAFCKAVEHFDLLQENVQFGLYAKICIRNHLISYARAIRKQETVVSLEESESHLTQADLAEALVEKENFLALYRQIEALLSPYESRVWWLYLSGRTAREIAASLGKEERSVQNAIYRIRKKLRASLPYP